jgi:hypothetical protein
MTILELFLGALVGAMLGPAIYWEVQRLKPIVARKLQSAVMYVRRCLAGEEITKKEQHKKSEPFSKK